MRANVSQGRLDRAVAIIKEAYEAGFDPFDAIEHDAEAAKLRSFKPYRDLVSDIDAKNLARARERVKEEFARTTSYVFDFNTKDLDGKPLSLDQFKGQVLLVDLWGTWCKPCREAIPGLIQLQHKHRRRGFDLIGLDYEQNVTDPAKTEQLVKKFVQESGIPYRIAMFDDSAAGEGPQRPGIPDHAAHRPRGEGPAPDHRRRPGGPRGHRRRHRGLAGRAGTQAGGPVPGPCRRQGRGQAEVRKPVPMRAPGVVSRRSTAAAV